MRKEFEAIKEQFPIWLEIAGKSDFYGVPVTELDKDELLAMVGCVGRLLVIKDLEAHDKGSGDISEVNSFSVS